MNTITMHDGSRVVDIASSPDSSGWTVVTAEPPESDGSEPVVVIAWDRTQDLSADTDRANGVPWTTRLVVPGDCQSDPWGLEDRWVDAETGEPVLPPDRGPSVVPTHLVDGRLAVAINEAVEDGSQGLYEIEELAHDDWPARRLLPDGTVLSAPGCAPATVVEIKPA